MIVEACEISGKESSLANQEGNEHHKLGKSGTKSTKQLS